MLALVTRPPRKLHGKTQAEVNPMRELALRHGTPIHEPESINAPAARMLLASYRPDLFVVCDYGQILSSETLEIARLGGINLHASLLPKYRGAAPINWALYHGETETGVTIIHMAPRVDAGPAILQRATPIGPEETAAQLEPRLAALGADSCSRPSTPWKLAPPARSNRIRARPPGPRGSLRSWARSTGRASAAAIHDQVRALEPWPKTHTFWQRPAGEPLRLILERVHVVSPDAGGSANAQRIAAPGTVLAAAGSELVVATGAGPIGHRRHPAGRQARALDRRIPPRLRRKTWRPFWPIAFAVRPRPHRMVYSSTN